MTDVFDKILKKVDAVADVLTGDTKAIKKTSFYSYTDFIEYCKRIKQREPKIRMAIVSSEKINSFEGVIFSQMKYYIKIVFLDEDSHPLLFDDDENAYLGMIVLADTIDVKFQEFIGEDGKKKVRLN